MNGRPATPADRARPLEESRRRTAAELAPILRRFGEPLPDPRHAEEFGAAFDRFGAARVVLLGEETHGTAEFYQARAAITRRLVERHGFTLVAVEADWPDAARVDDYVRHRAGRPRRWEAFTRFPQWMWRNAEFLAFTEWLRLHNRDLSEQRRVAFRGLDIYSLNTSIAAVLDFIDRRDPVSGLAARRRYGCLTPWQAEPERYGRAVMLGQQDCEAEVVAQLNELLALRLKHLEEDGESFLDAAQNARIVRAAERYYRTMYRSSTESWNLRDRHMFETLERLMDASLTRKTVVWAHNSHVGNAAATAMGWQGEFNIGELCRKAWGDEAVLIGFGTDRGTVAAAADWDAPVEIMDVRPSREDSYEHAFRAAGVPRSLTEWIGTGRAELAQELSRSLLERAIGVIYRPETELQSHYFECSLSEQFDAWVWFESTRAVTPIAAGHATGMPETYPFGM